MGNFLFLAANLSLNLFFFCALFDVFLGSWCCRQWLWWIQHWLGARSSNCWEKITVHERRRWSPQGKVSNIMAWMIAMMVGLAMARKPWASHAGVHHHSLTESWANLANILAHVAWLSLTCHWMSFVFVAWLSLTCHWMSFVFVALLVLFLAQVAILGLVHHPFHVVDASMPSFLANLFVLIVCCLWVASSSILCPSFAIACLCCPCNSYGLILTCIGSLFFWFGPWHQFRLSLLASWVDSLMSLSSLS